MESSGEVIVLAVIAFCLFIIFGVLCQIEGHLALLVQLWNHYNLHPEPEEDADGTRPA